MKTFKLSEVVRTNSFMRIALDGNVELDENGNFLLTVGYIRVSTESQAETGYGLDIQEKKILEYCYKNDMSSLLLFVDDGYTGTDMDRPALQSIIKMITDYNHRRSKLRINTMIIPKIDRLGRTMLGTLQFIQDYIVAKDKDNKSKINENKEDINFISVDENYCRVEKNNPQGKFLLMLFASLAEFDRDLIVGKLKDGRRARAAAGKWQGGGVPPYGYIYDSKKGELIVVPEQADEIREVYRLYIEEKLPPQKIADKFGYRSEKFVVDILKRKLYAGYITRYTTKNRKTKKQEPYEEYPGIHERIISLETWLDAQDVMNSRKAVRGDSNYLLTGLLVCGECGAKMRYQKWGKSVKLVCYSQQKSKSYLVKDENCQLEKYDASDVDNAVVAELFRMTYLGNEDNKKTAPHFDPVVAIKTTLKTEENKLSKYYEMWALGQGNKEILSKNMRETEKRVEELKKQLNDEVKQLQIEREIDNAKEIFRDLKGTWEHMSAKDKQKVCKELIEKVVISKGGLVDVHLKLRSYLIDNHPIEEAAKV